MRGKLPKAPRQVRRLKLGKTQGLWLSHLFKAKGQKRALLRTTRSKDAELSFQRIVWE